MQKQMPETVTTIKSFQLQAKILWAAAFLEHEIINL